MANLAQMVNVIAPVFTNTEGLFLQTTYHPIRMISQATLPVVVDTWVDGPTHQLVETPETTHWLWPVPVSDMNPFQILDVAATRDEEHTELVLTVVNRDPVLAHSAVIEVIGAKAGGLLSSETVGGGDPEALNDFGVQNVAPVMGLVTVAADGTAEFPPCSVTVLKFPLSA
jgi:alpha-N-arabinofuranosidase